MARFKRILSMLLAIILCVGVLPISSIAATPDGLSNFVKRNSFKSDIFSDVTKSDWFYDDVKTAYELGLMLGRGENTFDTESGVTIAETITIAARIHSIYYTGSDDFDASTPWYKVYADYASANGILYSNVTDYAKTATRAEFVSILSNALPAAALEEINKVAVNSIPDVKTTDVYGAAVYKLYRAGIMIGNNEAGTFAPDSEIRRSEVAAISARMADKSLRKSVQLGKEYTITFDMNGKGKQVPAQTVVEGYAIEKPADPSKATYVFKGWYTQKSGGSAYDFSAPVYGDVTLYARWEMDPVWMALLIGMMNNQNKQETTYTVSFESNGGTPVTSQTVKQGETAVMPVDPDKSGFAFGGWYADAALMVVYDFTAAVNSDMVLYAKWTASSPTDQTVPVEIAELFGINPNESDTDGDGLSNYVEIYATGTEPTMADSDEDGISDADEDADEDGLTNRTELLCGTDLTKKDTDSDGLSDFEETTIYNTDPVNYDSDGDTLSDGDEIYLGLNPLMQKTDGITFDSERIFTQTLSENNVSDELLSEDNAATPTLTLTASGNINNDVTIEPTSSNAFSDSRAIIGEAIDIVGDNISDGTISFVLRDAGTSLLSLQDMSDLYSTSIICKYNEDGITEYLDTDYNASTNTLSASVEGEGTYFVLDVKNLFDELGLVLPSVSNIELLSDPAPMRLGNPALVSEDESVKSNGEAPIATFTLRTSANPADLDSVAAASADAVKVTTASSNVRAQADIVFIVDTTGSMGDEIDNVKNNISHFVDALNGKGISAALALIDYEDITADGYDSTRVHKNGSSNWFYNVDDYKTAIANLTLGWGGDTPECAVDALETARLLDIRASAGKIFILVTDADYKVDNRYGIPSMSAEIELLKNAGVSCSVVSPSYEQSTYYNLYTETNGMWTDIYGNFYEELMTLADKIGSDIVGDGYWIYLDGPVPVPVRLDKDPSVDPTADTDGDGVLDIDELESTQPTGEIDLDKLIAKVSKGEITGTNYGVVKMYKYKSSPVELDTDFDGTDDRTDDMPKSNSFEGEMHYELDSKQKTCVIDFTMDYRNLIDGSNTQYSKDLSELAILYASDVYDDLYIKLNKGAVGGDDNPTTFGKLLGLEDTNCYKLKSSSYTVDKDDITEFFVGHKNIRYNGKDHEVIIVSVRGTNGTNAEWSSNFDVGADTTEYYDATGYDHPDWLTKDNHKGFDVSANRVLDLLLDYIDTYVDSSAQKSILVTGHSRGAAIANIIGAYFENDVNYRSYTYTFATPNSTTASNAGSYRTIFNIKNTDDIIPYLPIFEWGFTNYGVTKEISVEDNYENKWWGAQEGTWEWFIGVDYNNDGGTSRTLNSFSKIASSREDLYKLDTGSDGKVWENNLGHTTYSGAEAELIELKATLESEKLLKFCNVYIVDKGFLYYVEINYSPAYLMQTLCNMTTSTGPMLGHDVKGKYASAKASFVASSGKVVVGGMTHPHMQPTYYIIAHNGFRKVD